MEAMVAEQIVALIDEAGYLRADLSELAQRLGVPLGLVEAVLAGVQDFDPSGVGGRDLAECIAIQAREADRYDPAMACMIAHLDLVAKGAFPHLKRICGVDDERSEEHTSGTPVTNAHLVCRLLLEKKNK